MIEAGRLSGSQIGADKITFQNQSQRNPCLPLEHRIPTITNDGSSLSPINENNQANLQKEFSHSSRDNF